MQDQSSIQLGTQFLKLFLTSWLHSIKMVLQRSSIPMVMSVILKLWTRFLCLLLFMMHSIQSNSVSVGGLVWSQSDAVHIQSIQSNSVSVGGLVRSQSDAVHI